MSKTTNEISNIGRPNQDIKIYLPEGRYFSAVEGANHRGNRMKLGVLNPNSCYGDNRADIQSINKYLGDDHAPHM